MRTFSTLTSRIAPLPGANIDTDQIIPASYLKITDKAGLGKGLFANWRYDEAGEPRPEFILNQPDYAEARILLAGDNFGSGSSREHAAWALQEHGFEVVISTRFADIFQANAAKNGLLTATVESGGHADLMQLARETPANEITVDLHQKLIEAPGIGSMSFAVDPFVRHCLLNGIDQLGFLLDHRDAIKAYEAKFPQRVRTVADQAAEG